ncbi:hypothetical protein [Photobacterium makurazakiensis]|uniref:hypothetical protein n=1 Tax=Photobacterium makurazakiensis TaxID=2910234 RepID=UPI003D0D6653
MTKYIGLLISFFSIYLAVEIEDILLISFSLLGYFSIVLGFIVDSVSSQKEKEKITSTAVYSDKWFVE